LNKLFCCYHDILNSMNRNLRSNKLNGSIPTQLENLKQLTSL